jgi:ubiquinone/menaquinone biosynthesis C-methylase UbiE
MTFLGRAPHNGAGAPVVRRNQMNRSQSWIKINGAMNSDRVSSQDVPTWTGDTFVSRAVNAAISSPLLFGLMKLGARQQFKMTAEKNGIPWGGVVETLSKSSGELEGIFGELADPELEYPEYYRQPFHGYDEGNLNWLAAYEAEPATYSMAMRVWKEEDGLSPVVAQERLRSSAFDQVKRYLQQHGTPQIRDIIDIGCSVGLSTRYLANSFPDAKMMGLDLSPYFLSVARFSQLHPERALFERSVERDISYVHGNAENMAALFPDESFDMVSGQFILHELPPMPTKNILKECLRILRPGGVVFFVDNNPKSDVIQNLPPAIFTLMKSTEPHSDEYYGHDCQDCLESVGFVDIQTTECDPRHRLIIARKMK